MRLVVVSLLIIITGCTGSKGLMGNMHAAQKRAIAVSPYNTAKTRAAGAHLRQKDKFGHFPPFLRARVLDAVRANDTVRILESYDLYCTTCPGFQTQVQVKDTVYTVVNPALAVIQSVIDRGVKAEVFDTEAVDHNYLAQYYKLIDVARHRQSWNTQPLRYGNDTCKDNSYSMVTIILPGGKAETMYVRCWTPFFKR